MKHYIKYLTICLLQLLNLNLTGKDKNFISDSLKVINLTAEGRSLHRDGMYAEALDSFLLSLEITKKNYAPDNYAAYASIYRYLAITYKNIGVYEQAIKYSQLAEQAYVAAYGKNYNLIAAVYLNLGNIYKSKLNYREALDYYKQMISIYQNQKKVNQASIAGVYYSISDVYYRMNRYKDAIQTSLQHMDNATDDDKILFYELLGAAYQELKQNEKAYQSYQEAIDLSSKIYSEQSIVVAFEYLNLANFLITIGKTENAANAINKAKPIIFSDGNEKGFYASLFYRNKGLLAENKHIESKDVDVFKQEKIKNISDAIFFFKKALEALNFPSEIITPVKLDSIQNSYDVHCLNLIKYIGNAYTEIANIYEGEQKTEYNDNVELALGYYQIASSFLQQLRKEISGDDNKILLAGLEQSTFYDVVKTSYLAYKIDDDFSHLKQAFTNAERMKSGSIFDKLEETLAKNNSLIPDSLIQKEQILNARVTAYKEQRFNEITTSNPNSVILEKIDSIIFQLNQQRNDLNAYMESNYSDYYDLKYSSSLFNVEDIQHKLKNDEVLIEYVLNESDSVPELYSILIDNQSAKLIKQDIDNQFIIDIESTYHFMSDPMYMYTKNEDSKKFCVMSNKLYEKLIKPFEIDILDKKITIVPDGKLNYIAFDALLSEMPDTTANIRFNDLNYLIKKNCINYSYSANLLYKFSGLTKKANRSVLAFAPEYKKDTFTFDNQKLALTPLPGVQNEVEIISSEIKTKVFSKADATEANFRKNSEKFDILHLAMHAFINDSLPAFSRLAFAQHTGNNPETDGWLNTADIYNLNLNARLTVLSACNTGSGALQKGEGVMSLARGFLYAGCPSIVMTLWEAEDNSTTTIMSSFYKYLKKGKSKDEALRLAKLEYLSESNPRLSHPHYWLGYVSIGDSSPLYRSYDFYFFSLLILAFIGIAIEQILRIKKARKLRT